MHFSAKKFFLITFVVLLLIGIPVSVYFIQQQTEIQSRAEKATNITLIPASSTKAVGDDIPLDIMVDPGTNLVSFVKLEIQYDPDKISASEDAFEANSVIFPSVLEGPIYAAGKIAVTLSVGSDPTKAVQAKVRAATITLKAKANTGEDTPTLISFSSNTQALSVGPNDQASENVLASTSPASIIITGESAEPTETTEPEPTETTEPEPTEAEEPTETGDGGGTSPVCSSFTADKSTTGSAPLVLTFTAVATDPDDNITKVTFNFGDGQVSDVTTGGGVGTDSVNVKLAHTYSSAGNFQASAIFTDESDGVSSTDNCTATLIVSSGEEAATPTPTIAPSGSTAVLVGAGAASILLIIGGLLFLIL